MPPSWPAVCREEFVSCVGMIPTQFAGERVTGCDGTAGRTTHVDSYQVPQTARVVVDARPSRRARVGVSAGAIPGPRERRTCTKLVRLSSGELAAISLRAAECRRPVACYIREAALGAALHARHSPVNDALVRELARLANQLDTLGRAAKERELPIAPEFDRALEALLTTIRAIE